MIVQVDVVRVASPWKKHSDSIKHCSHFFDHEVIVVFEKQIYLTMVFGCFDPITGGRVGEIVAQESKLCGGKDSLPLSKEQDKFEKFCETYKDFIDVADAYEKFLGNWERQKAAAGDTLQDKRRYSLILRALFRSFTGDLLKAFFSKLVWSILVIFSIWFFVFEILDYIKAKNNGTATGVMKNHELCPFFL